MRFVSYADRKKTAAALRPIYTVPTAETAQIKLRDPAAADRCTGLVLSAYTQRRLAAAPSRTYAPRRDPPPRLSNSPQPTSGEGFGSCAAKPAVSPPDRNP